MLIAHLLLNCEADLRGRPTNICGCFRCLRCCRRDGVGMALPPMAGKSASVHLWMSYSWLHPSRGQVSGDFMPFLPVIILSTSRASTVCSYCFLLDMDAVPGVLVWARDAANLVSCVPYVCLSFQEISPMELFSSLLKALVQLICCILLYRN